MELFLLEHKKLWRRAGTKISVFVCFLDLVVFGCILSFQWFNFGSKADFKSNDYAKNFDGYAAIRDRQEYALSFGGDLTDESMQQIVRDYQRMESVDAERAWDLIDWVIINDWMGNLWPELHEAESYQVNISYFEPEKLTDFYGRRQLVLEKYLENNNQTGKEKEYLLQIDEKVRKPFHYGWIRGWQTLLSITIDTTAESMALFLAVVLSTLFAGEWHDNTSSLALTTKNGWKKIAAAKIATGLVFTVELFIMIAICDIASQLFFMGTTGWDMPVQLIKLIAIAPMNMLQAEIYEWAFTLLGMVGFAGIVMLISAAVKSNVLALILSLAVVYVPTVIDPYLPFGLQKALSLIPLVGSGTDIFRTYTFHIFGKYVWSPYLLITVPVLIGIVCMPFAVKNWARRMKV
ncbi:MAG: ABC transporter permease subunit [Lachnospiraceae bacterium]|nr:ABC transporter permease subunit [Lachnospiraceae bacterium]